MKNTAKHSIKCHKRDTVEPISVNYLIYGNDGCYYGSYTTKLEALRASCNLGLNSYLIKVTRERVIS